MLGYQCCLFLRRSHCHAGIIHVVFIITLFLPLYFFIVFIYFISYVGLFVLWCFNAIFNKFSVLSWRSVFWLRKPEDREKTNLISYVRRLEV